MSWLFSVLLSSFSTSLQRFLGSPPEKTTCFQILISEFLLGDPKWTTKSSAGRKASNIPLYHKDEVRQTRALESDTAGFSPWAVTTKFCNSAQVTCCLSISLYSLVMSFLWVVVLNKITGGKGPEHRTNLEVDEIIMPASPPSFPHPRQATQWNRKLHFP